MADTGGHCVRAISPTDSGEGGGRRTVRTVAGSTAGERGHRDGPAAHARFDSPAAVAAPQVSE